MRHRTWSLDDRLHAFQLDDFSPQERALAWLIAVAWHYALYRRELPAHCRELNDTGELDSLDLAIDRVLKIREDPSTGDNIT